MTGLVVTPGIMLSAAFATHVLLMMVFTVSLWAGGGSAWDLLWGPAPLLSTWLALIWATVAAALWQAPIAAWLLVASAWAKGSRFLWAIGAPLAIGLLERMLLGTTQFFFLIGERFGGWWTEAFTVPEGAFSVESLGDETNLNAAEALEPSLLSYVDIGGFLVSPGLWGGFVVTAGLLAAAIYVRRYREPV